MLEVRYNTITKEITGWCGDETQFENMPIRIDEVVVIIPEEVPNKPSEAWLMDEILMCLIPNPTYIEPVDWITEWNAATTLGKQIRILAKMQGLEE